MKETLGFLEKREYSLLERRPSSQRMRERDEAGKHLKKHNKQQKMKHANEDFWKEWENENQ